MAHGLKFSKPISCFKDLYEVTDNCIAVLISSSVLLKKKISKTQSWPLIKTIMLMVSSSTIQSSRVHTEINTSNNWCRTRKTWKASVRFMCKTSITMNAISIVNITSRASCRAHLLQSLRFLSISKSTIPLFHTVIDCTAKQSRLSIARKLWEGLLRLC